MKNIMTGLLPLLLIFLNLLTGAPSAFANPDSVLIVIDVQPQFLKYRYEEDRKDFLAKISAQIEKAKDRHQTIIFVAYEQAGSFEQGLLDQVAGYDRFEVVKKVKDDGSFEVKRALDLSGIKSEKLKVCGLNTNFCVRETVSGLVKSLDRINQVTLLGDSCSDWEPASHCIGLQYLSHLPKVVVKAMGFKQEPLRDVLKPFVVSESEESRQVLEFRALLSTVNLLFSQEPMVVFYASGRLHTLIRDEAETKLPEDRLITRALFEPLHQVYGEVKANSALRGPLQDIFKLCARDPALRSRAMALVGTQGPVD